MKLVMEWPQIVTLVLCGLSIAGEGYLHGQQKPDKFNVGAAIVRAFLLNLILYYGGFWRFAP